MSTGSKKIVIKVETTTEQQENLKNSRKTLKILQKTSVDKENLTGRISFLKDGFTKSKSENELIDIESKRKRLVTHACQTDPEKLALAKITEEDLISNEEPGEHYWKLLAEKRRIALDISLHENEELHEKIINLEDELNTSRAMLEESRNLVEILTEMLQEAEGQEEFELGECSKNLSDVSTAEEAAEIETNEIDKDDHNTRCKD